MYEDVDSCVEGLCSSTAQARCWSSIACYEASSPADQEGVFLLCCFPDVVQGEEIKGKSYYTNETYFRDGPAYGNGIHDAYYN